MNITHLSVSRANLFDECHQKYKFQYHLKHPPEEAEPFHFIYGKIIHKIAEEYVRGKGSKILTDVTQSVLKGEIEFEKGKKAPPLPRDYQARMPDHLRSIQFLTDSVGYDGLLEWPFEYDLDPPNNRRVIGFMDRVVIKGNKAWIFDYKTTKRGPWRKTQRDVTSDLQLRCYAMIVQREFNIPAEDIQSVLFYLEGKEMVGARFSQSSLDLVKEELLTVYKMIENADPDRVVGRVGSHCNRCGYKTICPFFTTAY